MREDSGLRRRTVHGLVWSAIESWGSQLISLAVFIILARYLAPEAFGLLGMAAVFIALVNAVVDQGLSDALVQRRSLDDGHRDTAFWSAAVAGLLFTGSGLLLARPIAAFFDEPVLAPVVAWLSASIFIGSLAATQTALLRRALSFRPLALRTLGGTLVGGVVGVGMAIRGFGVWALVGQQLASSVVATVLLWFASDWRPGLHLSWSRFQDLFRFGSRVMGSNLVNFLNRHADNLFIGAYLGAAALGLYTVAYRFLTTVTTLLTGFSSSVAFPAFSKLQDDPQRLRDALATATYLTSLVSFPAFVGAALVAPELIEVVFGARWLETVPIMRILAFIGILHSVFYFTNNVFWALGHAGWVLGLNLLNAITNVLAFWIAVRWGIVIVAAVYVARGYLVAPLRLALLRRALDLPIRRYLATMAVPATATTIMAGSVIVVLAWLRPSAGATFRLTAAVVIGVVSYAALVWALDAGRIRALLTLADGTHTSDTESR